MFFELYLLLLLLSRFSCVRLCATPQTAAHQALPSLEFSRQEHWSGLPFLLQCMKVKSEREVAQSCPTLPNPMGCSLPGSSSHGIFQARVLEWGAIDYGPKSQSSSVQFSSVAQTCRTLCDPMNCSTPGLPVHHQLPEFTQTHVH